MKKLIAFHLLFFVNGIFLLGCFTTPLFAQDGGTNLATAATNPVGSANQLQLQNIYSPDSKNSSGDANTFIVQPIVAFDLPKGGYFQGIVTRFTLPYVSTPEIGPGKIDASAWGDTTGLIIPTHTESGSKAGEFSTWGPILSVGIPTSNDDLTGSGLWSAGPGIIGLKNVTYDSGNSLMYGVLAWHLWNVEDDDDVDTSVTSGFPIAIYKFGDLFKQKGWYIRAPDDTWNYDWEENEFTQIPVGLAAGRVFKIGKQAVNTYLGGWYNAADPDTAATSDWAIKLSFSLVFPK